MDAAVDSAATRPSLGERRKRWLLWLGIGLLLLTVLVVLWWWLFGRNSQSTDDAYVAGDLVSVISQVSGTVISSGADETDRVQAGQELIRLAATDARIALQDAEQQLARAVRQTRTVYANRDQLRAVVTGRRADLQPCQR